MKTVFVVTSAMAGTSDPTTIQLLVRQLTVRAALELPASIVTQPTGTISEPLWALRVPDSDTRADSRDDTALMSPLGTQIARIWEQIKRDIRPANPRH